MNYPLITKTGAILHYPSQLCQYLVRVHHEARHEEESDLQSLCQRFGIVEHVVSPLPPQTPEELLAIIRKLITQIQQARRRWLDENIDPDGLQLAMMLYQAGDEKGVAIFQWCVALGVQSELRQAQLEAGVIEWDDALCDFSMYPKPHSNAELMARAGLL